MPSSDQDNVVLNEAIGVIKTHASRTAVFLDIGHSAWVPAETVISRVNGYSNLTLLDGFASNTSNFRPTADEVAFARALYAGTGKPTIIDTSRNGLADSAGIIPSTVQNPPEDEWDVGISFAFHPDDPAVFFNYHNKPWNESD